MTKQEVIEWAELIKNSRDTTKEPIPFNEEMIQFFNKDDLKDYLLRIKHLQGKELWDDESYRLRVSDWSEIIYIVKKRIMENI